MKKRGDSMSDLLDKLRRYARASRSFCRHPYGSLEYARAEDVLKELEPCLHVARDIVTASSGAEYTVHTFHRQSNDAGEWYARTLVWEGTMPLTAARKIVWSGKDEPGSTATHERAVELVKSDRIEATGEDEE